jgi:hypothetical protein
MATSLCDRLNKGFFGRNSTTELVTEAFRGEREETLFMEQNRDTISAKVRDIFSGIE